MAKAFPATPAKSFFRKVDPRLFIGTCSDWFSPLALLKCLTRPPFHRALYAMAHACVSPHGIDL